jgi:hypothetical protein
MYSTRGNTLTLKDRLPRIGGPRAVIPRPTPKVEATVTKPAGKTAKPVAKAGSQASSPTKPVVQPAKSPPPPAAADPEAAAAKAARQAERAAALRRVEVQLRERWPAVFCTPRPPLAIGVHRQILEVVGDDIDEAELGRFFRWWTQRFDYLDAVAHREERRNLDGSPAGVPTPDQQCSAAITVYGKERGAVVLAKIRADKEEQ